MERLSALDNLFLQIESPATPMHVGGVLQFRAPRGRAGFAEELLPALRAPVPVASPFDRQLVRPRTVLGRGTWRAVPDFAPGPHVHEARCDEPGGRRELEELVAGLHVRPLDFSRPPWECHVIDGLAADRFAVYYKIHHACIDGVSGLRRMQTSLSQRPDEPTRPMWIEKRARLRLVTGPPPDGGGGPRELWRALARYRRLRRDHAPALPGFFEAPGTSMNRVLTPRRAVRWLDLDLGRARAVAAAAAATVNDVALALVTGILRGYLEARGELPARPLVAFVPVSLHDADSSERPSNRVCNVLVGLPAQLADPRARLAEIHAAMELAKGFIRSMPPATSTAFSMVLGAPAVIGQMLGLSGRLPLPFNVVVSNVAGPRQPLYHSGAPLEAIYPVSALFERQGLNVTLISYLDRLCVGLLTCPDVCDADALARATEAAWRELG